MGFQQSYWREHGVDYLQEHDVHTTEESVSLSCRISYPTMARAQLAITNSLYVLSCLVFTPINQYVESSFKAQIGLYNHPWKILQYFSFPWYHCQHSCNHLQGLMDLTWPFILAGLLLPSSYSSHIAFSCIFESVRCFHIRDSAHFFSQAFSSWPLICIYSALGSQSFFSSKELMWPLVLSQITMMHYPFLLMYNYYYEIFDYKFIVWFTHWNISFRKHWNWDCGFSTGTVIMIKTLPKIVKKSFLN